MPLVSLEARIENIVPLCGEHLVGTFVCGGSSGPQAVISQSVIRTLAWAVAVQGQGNVDSPSLVRGRELGVEVGGKAEITSPLNQSLVLAAQVAGSASVKAKVFLRWVEPTTEADHLLPATDEQTMTLLPTTAGSWLLASSAQESQTAPATEVEERQLVPAIVRQG